MRIFNFDAIKNHPNDIEEFTVNAESLVDNIYIGPQGDLLEKLDSFNRSYGIELAITKQFTLKPGGYDKIKKAYGDHVLRWDMKPRGIESIFKRIREYGWRFNQIKIDALELDRKMMEMRNTGLRWQDNTEDFGIEFDKLKSIIINALDVCKELYPNVEVKAKVLPTAQRRILGRGYRGNIDPFPEIIDGPANEYILVFYLYIKEPTMTVHVVSSDNRVDQYTFDCDDIICTTGTYFLPMISRNWGRDTLRDGTTTHNREMFFLEAMYLSPMNYSFHPYIQNCKDKYAYELEPNYAIPTHICLGNMQNELKSTLLNVQIEAHLTYIVTWLTNYYIPQTNPLNRIKKLYDIGKNKHFVEVENRVTELRLDVHPESCNLHHVMDSSIFSYARGQRRSSFYSNNNYTVEQNGPEYKQRLVEYLSYIKEEDLPCNDCSYHLDCDQETNIRMYLSEKPLEPMEEAYLGMYHEMHRLWAFSSNDHSHHFIEEDIFYANRWHIYDEYNDLMLSCEIANLATTNDEEKTWGLNRWTDVIRMTHRKSFDVKQGLKKVGTSLANWDTYEIDEYSIPAEHDSSKEVLTSERIVDAIHRQQLENVANEVEIRLEREELTPEELTLRWASREGGASNL